VLVVCTSKALRGSGAVQPIADMAHRPPQDSMDGSGGGGSRGGTPVPLRFALVNPEAAAGPAVSLYASWMVNYSP
jgi:hypothetical protein